MNQRSMYTLFFLCLALQATQPYGQYCPADDQFYTCANGSIASAYCTVTCTQCVSPNYANIGKTECIANCGIGYYGDTGDRQCKQCGANTYSVDYATACYPCSSGYYIKDSVSNCNTICPAGKYVEYTATTLCLDCPINTYTSSNGSLSCTPCSTGFYSSAGATVCNPQCGDGRRVGSEACDDQNTSNGDGCSSTCTIETGFTCSGGGVNSNDVCSTICGDGKKVVGKEACEDGNLVNGDGCSSTCAVETGYSCSGGTISHVDTIINYIIEIANYLISKDYK